MAIGRGDLVGSVAALALLAQCAVANATRMTTAPEIDMFNLTPAQVIFQVSNDGSNGGPVITNTNNGPKTASSLLNFDKFNPGLGVLTGGIDLVRFRIYAPTAPERKLFHWP
jgi:hypothetical protein